MSKQLTALDYLGNVDKFSTLFIRVNELVTALNVETVTVNSLANGALSSGNGFVNGIFGANTLVVTTLRGGNVQSSGNLTISSNVSFTGNILNISTTATVNIGSHFANATHSIIPTQVSVGNSTVNLVLSSNSITIGGTAYSNLAPRVTVSNNFTTIGTRGKINFKPSNAIQLLLEDDAANDCISITIVNNETPTASGSNTYVQINDMGVFGATAGFTFNKTTNTVYVANNLSTNNIILIASRTSSINTITTGTSSQVVDTFTVADFRSGDFILSIKDNAANNFQVSKLLVLFTGGTH